MYVILTEEWLSQNHRNEGLTRMSSRENGKGGSGVSKYRERERRGGSRRESRIKGACFLRW